MIDLYDPSGKDIFEAKYIDATFDPKTRMYKQKFRPNDENDNRYIFRSYTSMKYLLNEWNENYFLKYTEQNYLYEGLIVSYDIDTACYLLEEFNKTSNLLKDIGVEYSLVQIKHHMSVSLSTKKIISKLRQTIICRRSSSN